MPDGIEDWLTENAKKTRRTATVKIERVVDGAADGVLRVEGSETVFEDEGIVTQIICQNVRGQCGHIVSRENIVRCSEGHDVCRECIVACQLCGRLLCPQEKREFVEGKILCWLCFHRIKTLAFFPLLR